MSVEWVIESYDGICFSMYLLILRPRPHIEPKLRSPVIQMCEVTQKLLELTDQEAQRVQRLDPPTLHNSVVKFVKSHGGVSYWVGSTTVHACPCNSPPHWLFHVCSPNAQVNQSPSSSALFRDILSDRTTLFTGGMFPKSQFLRKHRALGDAHLFPAKKWVRAQIMNGHSSPVGSTTGIVGCQRDKKS